MHLLHFLSAALLASINELGSFSPFAAAFVCSVDRRYMLTASFGAGLGYIFTQNSISAFKYLAAIICAAVMSGLCSELEALKKLRMIPSCVSFLTLFLADMAVMLANEISVASFIMYLGEACVGFVCSFLFCEAFDSVKLYKSNGGILLRDMQIIVFCISLLLFSVSSITLAGASPARLFLVFLLLSLSYVYDSPLISASAGAALVFTIGDTLDITALAYSIATLVLGVFSGLHRYLRAFAFAAAFAIGFAFCDGSAEKAAVLAETAFACVIFASLPERLYDRLKIFLTVSREPTGTSSQREAVLGKLRTASSALGDVSYCVGAASDMIKSDLSGKPVGFYSRVIDEVCSGCKRRDYCWKINFADSRKSFELMAEALGKGKRLAPDSLPGFVSGHCVNASRLAVSFTDNYYKYISRRSAQRKAERIRSLTNEQFSGICAMLAEFSEEFSEGIRFDERLANEIGTALAEQFSLKPELLICIRDAQGHLKLEIRLKEKPKKLNEADFRQLLETVCRTELSRPVVAETDSGIIITLCQQTTFRVEAAASRVCAENQSQCGDSYEGFYDGKGNYIVVLSDGMGTGLRAAIDSSLTATITARLLRAGISCEAAMRMVNSSLLLRSVDESLATLDIICIDLYTGKATFYKAGASLSLVKKKSRVIDVEMASMPLGILDSVNYSRKSLMLGDEDVVLMASDGAFEFSEEKVKNGFSVILDDSVSEVSERMMALARAGRVGKRSDDITVISVRLCKNI